MHFPYLLRRPVLDTARAGVLNLHPSYLPYNRGWHTPTWAILDGTPAGASLHYIDESLDTGDLVCQKQAEIDPSDTAHTLYAKLKVLEVQVFTEGMAADKGRTCTSDSPGCGSGDGSSSAGPVRPGRAANRTRRGRQNGGFSATAASVDDQPARRGGVPERAAIDGIELQVTITPEGVS